MIRDGKDIKAGTLAASVLASDSVTAAKIATDAVGSAEIAADAVGTSEIAADGVGAAEIAEGAVGASEIAADGVGAAEIAEGAVGASETAVVDADGLGDLLVLRKAFTAGVTGAADDVEIYNANAPFAFRVIDVHIKVSTLKAGATATLRSASAGGGSALSDALSVENTGVVRDAALTASGTISASGSLYIRRSDRACAGEMFIYIQKT